MQSSHPAPKVKKGPSPSLSQSPPSSSAHRASPTGVQIGADLLSQPPPLSKDLTHLVGRSLVPFFTEDGAENMTHDLHQNEHLDFGVETDEGQTTQVRTFVDGYFVNQGTLAPSNQQTQQQQQQHTQQQHTQQHNKHANKANKHQKQQQQQQQQQPPQPAVQYPPPQQQPNSSRKQKKGQVAATNPSSSASSYASVASCSSVAASAAPPSRLYAGAAFLASPSPLQVPLPKFLTNKSPNSPDHASNKSTPSHSHSNSTSASSVSHVHDPLASASLLNLIRGTAPQSPKLMLLRDSSQEKGKVVVSAVSVHTPHHAPSSTYAAPPHPSPHHTITPSHSHSNTFEFQQPTLLPSNQHVPMLPYAAGYMQPQTHMMQQPQPSPHHAHPHYSAPVSSYYSAAAYQPPHVGPPPSSSSAVPLPSAVYSRYDRPQLHTAATHGAHPSIYSDYQQQHAHTHAHPYAAHMQQHQQQINYQYAH